MKMSASFARYGIGSGDKIPRGNRLRAGVSEARRGAAFAPLLTVGLSLGEKEEEDQLTLYHPKGKFG
jgi:hypothetical protein